MMVHVCFLAVEGFYDVIERTRLYHTCPHNLSLKVLKFPYPISFSLAAWQRIRAQGALNDARQPNTIFGQLLSATKRVAEYTDGMFQLHFIFHCSSKEH